MTQYTHVTVPTQFVEADDVRFAYRRFGAETGTPLLFFQPFRGNMDLWDPAITDRLGEQRPIILFDNVGVGQTSGETPETIEEMADAAATFLGAIGVSKVDLLGFSLGGFVAQAFTLRHPELVRRIILAGTRPRGGIDEGADPEYVTVATRNEVPTVDDFLFLFFEQTPTSQAAGRAHWDRRHLRTVDRDVNTSQQTMKAQGVAAAEWAQVKGERYAELKKITQPTLVVNGKRDIMIPTINSYVLAQELPDAQLIIYPDTGHGSLFQYPELFVYHASHFLDS
ncbi:alpha/beta hydrolase [Kibdelosporangium philippinense]|uniref:Alpha/beta hydrolase n=1 Tax=Kibdelosporangium philippinense TaxID=211113 RepID=A0ABS8ZT00_9PSEU|nr:alpha/beta hydrolase [Kibdelosporangium philippinense]MCE7010802.1 alpha/beta hydrolase [Kibdelosporangium philippinense]